MPSRRIILVSLAAGVIAAATTPTAAFAGGGHGGGGSGGGGGGGSTTQAEFNSIPTSLPGNVASTGFEATSASEFGDEVGLSGPTPRKLSSVTVTFSDWACQSGHWYDGTCATTDHNYFSMPITVNLYSVNNATNPPSPGSLLATTTQTKHVIFRPSSDTGGNCPADAPGGVLETAWFDGTNCYHGLAQNLTFAFSNHPSLPSQVIWTVAFNTTHYGSAPYGESAACFSDAATGCPYDSLNVGDETFGPPTVGTDIQSDGAFVNYQQGGSYCDGGTGGSGFLRLDIGSGNCWTGYTPMATITTSSK